MGLSARGCLVGGEGRPWESGELCLGFGQFLALPRGKRPGEAGGCRPLCSRKEVRSWTLSPGTDVLPS